ncbi:MAG: tRNA (adenosine(37)-N6)-threonylcarbamoyltransferase complex ATPase subunit type 1 TsaE [Candidatus Moranbacteria bacterium]|nr:tRNA (adenosine(37)-N6)-threonylcarbamoyltransferase complex ATPase subunit type 1 TsaE [Candidatus Moranbacteria bacterium]
MKSYITNSSAETKKLGELLARELYGGEIICLSGELGSGKTTFAQGLLKGLKIKGPHTSPTFVIIKQYHVARNTKHITNKKSELLRDMCYVLCDIYHIDAYRVTAKDILNLGWGEIIKDKSNIIIVEWADRIRKIIPKGATRIKFEWVSENKRKITLMSS